MAVMKNTSLGSVSINVSQWHMQSQLWDIYMSYKENLYSIRETQVLVIIVLYILIFLMALFGNGIFLLVLVKQKRSRTNTNYFLLNLAITDLLVAVLCVPMTVLQHVYKAWPYGLFLCKITPFVEGVCVAVSILTITSLSVDRFIAVKCPMTSRRMNEVTWARCAISGVWFLAVTMMIPVAVVRQLHKVYIIPEEAIFFCEERWSNILDRQIYDVFLLFVIFVIPGVTMTVLYSIMGRRLWGTENSLQRRDSDISCAGRLSIQRKRVAKMSVCIAVWFALCWLPYHILNTYVNCQELEASQMELNLLSFALVLGHSNSAANPILYCFLNKSYRKSVIRLLTNGCSLNLRSPNRSFV